MKVTKVILEKEYEFMYENFVVSTQHDLYLMLQKNGDQVHALKFNFQQYKYGHPNDEALGAHPLIKFGLGFYGLFLVEGSSWIAEINKGNGDRLRNMSKDCSHYIATFKDVTLEVICRGFEEVTLSMPELLGLITTQASYLGD